MSIVKDSDEDIDNDAENLMGIDDDGGGEEKE